MMAPHCGAIGFSGVWVLSLLIYVDESGDLGWTFDRPYGQGGSSRYLTIAALLLPAEKDHLPQRIVRHLYEAGHWDKTREKKWVEMPCSSRETFAKAAGKFSLKHAGVEYRAIVVCKNRVKPELRSDSNKLYNWMLKLLLLDKIAQHSHVTLIPDPRTVKVANGRMLDHYMEMMLYERSATTQLEVTPLDSKRCLNLQFVDMLAGVVQSHFELNNSSYWNELQHHIYLERLFC